VWQPGGRLRIAPGADYLGGQAAWEADRARWLSPHRGAIARWLRAIAEGERAQRERAQGERAHGAAAGATTADAALLVAQVAHAAHAAHAAGERSARRGKEAAT
jgi:hypothetical protein